MEPLKVAIFLYALLGTVSSKSVHREKKEAIPQVSDDELLDELASVLYEEVGHKRVISKRQIDQGAIDICSPQGAQIGQNGKIRSPLLSDGTYPNNKHCTMTLNAPSNNKIGITIDVMDLEEDGTDCSYDLLKIVDGTANQYKYCGTMDDVPDDIKYVESTGPSIELRFSSDGSVTHSGFMISYVLIPDDDTNAVGGSNENQYSEGNICDGGILMDDFGRIISPTRPNGRYPNNLHCSITIQAPVDKVVSLHIDSFDVEYQANCQYDYLRVFDSSIGGRNVKLCGDLDDFDVDSMQSRGRTLVLTFHTDASDRYTGFVISYNFIDDPSIGVNPSNPCEGIQLLTAQTGTILSPGFGNGLYQNNLGCKWRIQANAGQTIRLSFSDFSLETHSGCQYDYLTIHDGDSTNARVLEKLCGSVLPEDVLSTGGNLFLEFRTDGSQTSRGFSLSYDIITPPAPQDICQNQNITTSGTIITSPGFNGNAGTYPNSASCNWTVMAAHDQTITLTFRQLHLEGGGCTYDYIAVYDGESQASGSLIGKYCGQVSGAAVRSSGKYMFIHFKSDPSVTLPGFEAEITFQQKDPEEDKGFPGCVPESRPEELQENEGEIRSSIGNGDKYPNNAECHWRISVPSGKVATIEFSSFRLEPGQGGSCVYDRVRIYDGADEMAPLISTHCGLSLPVPIEGTTNELYVTFTSDNSIVDNGFVATYAAKDLVQVDGGDDEPACGIPKIDQKMMKIVGGSQADRNAFPWQISLGYAIGNTYFQHFCGGSIISKYWIVTAAHCLVDDDGNVKSINEIGVKVGEHDQKDTNDPHEVNHRVALIIPHENYDPSTQENDIALLRLRTPIQYTVGVQPVCLPRSEEVEGMGCIISGWGETKGTAPGGNVDVLLYARVPIIERATCKQWDWYGDSMTDSMFCAGYPQGGKDTCQGDSGGPLVCRNRGQFTLYGVTSWGYGCAQPKRPGIYARVARYVPWLGGKTRDAFQHSP